jgi:hypothetical protein
MKALNACKFNVRIVNYKGNSICYAGRTANLLAVFEDSSVAEDDDIISCILCVKSLLEASF